MTAEVQTQSKAFVLSRVFDVPRDLLWQCFTDPERMKQWWGPKGVKILKAKMDLRPGGSDVHRRVFLQPNTSRARITTAGTTVEGKD